jgi:pyrroloquinoline quinone (PQQ) biosynthesis protein C
MTNREFLAQLHVEIDAHPGVNHLLLNRLATAPFSREDYRVLAENHIPLVSCFTAYLEVLLLRAPNSEARLWLAKVLVDEYGEGSDGHDHTEMYSRFLKACGGDWKEVHQRPVPSPALNFIRGHQKLVREEPFLVGLGAIGPGHEWAIPKMFDAIIPGLRRAGFTPEEMNYFDLHVEQDEDHGAWLEEALANYATTPLAQAQIREGALKSLEMRRQFWDGGQRAIVHGRQPRSIRQDAEKPRSLRREIGLTIWDGSSFATRLENRYRQWRTGHSPQIAELVAQARSING